MKRVKFKKAKKHLTGKFRRIILTSFSRKYTKSQLERRIGKCLRCGACCRLLFECPLMRRTKSGETKCLVHKIRPDICRLFPINETDILDRNEVDPGSSCGFYFIVTDKKKQNIPKKNLKKK